MGMVLWLLMIVQVRWSTYLYNRSDKSITLKGLDPKGGDMTV